MELNAVRGMLPVLERHDLALGGCRNDLQFSRDGFIDDERVITHALERRRDVFEDSLSIMIHRRSLAMHQTRCPIHFAAVDCAEALMPEADSQNWDLPSEMPDRVGRDTV